MILLIFLILIVLKYSLKILSRSFSILSNIINKESINKISQKVTDKAIQIKLNEVTNLLSPLGKISKVGNDDLVNLLQYYELLEELVKVNG